MLNKCCLILSLSLIVACTSQKEIMNSWLGSSKQSLIMSWGPPARTADDGAGGEILVYASQGYIPASTYMQAMTFWDYKMFWVNSSGKVYHWMTQRQQVPPMQIDLNVYRRY